MTNSLLHKRLGAFLVAAVAALAGCPGVAAQMPDGAAHAADSTVVATARELPAYAAAPDSVEVTLAEAVTQAPADSIAAAPKKWDFDTWEERDTEFNPNPTRAVWMSALFPGLGQLYNRRYWKLPIVVGAFMGLGYATSWNNNMLNDYTRAYRDIMDNDPSTNSYMNFFPPTTSESDLDHAWLTNILQSRKNFYRRNRDLCIIAIVGVYLVAMVDAYVDASLSHFDISPDLSIDVSPAVFQDGRNVKPSLGLVWALNF